MKKVIFTAKEIDAIKCMIEYFINNPINGFITRYHKKISEKELEELNNKIS